MELYEIALGFQERLLDQIRGTGFREQVAVHLLVGHKLEIGTAGFECRAERLARTRSGGGNPVGEFIVGVGHRPNLLGTGSVKIGHVFSMETAQPAAGRPCTRTGEAARYETHPSVYVLASGKSTKWITSPFPSDTPYGKEQARRTRLCLFNFAAPSCPGSGQNFSDHVSFHVGQSAPDSVMEEREPLMVEPEEMENRGVEVIE